jgi:hypothetical protein
VFALANVALGSWRPPSLGIRTPGHLARVPSDASVCAESRVPCTSLREWVYQFNRSTTFPDHARRLDAEYSC